MTCIIIFEYKIYQQNRKVFCFSRKLDSLRNTFIVSNVYNLNWKCRDDPYARLSARALTFRMEELNYVETLKFIVVCLMWYICSAGGNIIGKLVLNQFPFPMTVTMTQLVSISVYMEPIFWFLQTPNTGNIPRSYYFKLILPLAFGKFFSSVSSHISMWKSTVSYAHTGNRRTLYGGPFYTHWHIKSMKVTIKKSYMSEILFRNIHRLYLFIQWITFPITKCQEGRICFVRNVYYLGQYGPWVSVWVVQW